MSGNNKYYLEMFHLIKYNKMFILKLKIYNNFNIFSTLKIQCNVSVVYKYKKEYILIFILVIHII